MPWPHHDLAGAFAEGLRRCEEEMCLEQAVHGLDSLSEVSLHPILAAGAAGAGFAVFRETPYPGQPEVLPRESERERCDLVIAPGGTLGIADSIRFRKEVRRAEGTLFGTVAHQLAAPTPGEVLPEDALWLEVKTFGQFTYTDGLAGPNRSYASQFNVCTTDVRKLGRARGLGEAALVIVHFSADRTVAEHDLAAFVHRCLDKDLPVRGLIRETFPVLDRIGNTSCTVALVPVRCEDQAPAGDDA